MPTGRHRACDRGTLAQVGKTAKLKGFRPGKVPKKVVQQYYGGQVRERLVTDVIRTTYSRAIAEQKLNPAGAHASRRWPAIKERRALCVRANLRGLSRDHAKPLGELSIETPSVEGSETDLDAMIEKLQATGDVEDRGAQSRRERPRDGGLRRHHRRTVVRRRAGEEHCDRRRRRARYSRTSIVRYGYGSRREHDGDSAVPAGLPDEKPRSKTAVFAIDVQKVESGNLRPSMTSSPRLRFSPAAPALFAARCATTGARAKRSASGDKTRVFDALLAANRSPAVRGRSSTRRATRSRPRPCARW